MRSVMERENYCILDMQDDLSKFAWLWEAVSGTYKAGADPLSPETATFGTLVWVFTHQSVHNSGEL